MAIYSPSFAALTNPYKFLVYRNAALNVTNAFTVCTFDTTVFDTGSNVDIVTNKGRFTAPIAGFYWFSWNVGIPISGTDDVAAVYKNGSTYAWGNEQTGGNGAGSIIVQSAANDFWEIYMVANTTLALNVGTAPMKTWFCGHLLSAS